MAKCFRNNLHSVKTGVVEAFRNLQINKKRSFSQDMISTLEGSAKRFSLDIYRAALCGTLYLIDEDHELEEFVVGIPGLSDSEALRKFDRSTHFLLTTRDVWCASWSGYFSRATSMEHSPAISACDHERPVGVCLTVKNLNLS